MAEFPWLTTLGAVPLAGSLVVAALPRGRDLLAKRLALGVALAALGLAVVVASRFRAGGPQFQLVESHPWVPQFGVGYVLGVDGVGLVLIALAAVLTPIVILASWQEADGGRGSVKGFFALILALEGLTVGVFAALDVFLFYVFFEAMLVPMYFLIGRYGGPQRSYAAVKFLLYSLVGGLLMLVAVIGLYVVSARQLGVGTFDFTALTQAIRDGRLVFDPGTAKLLFLGFFVAFAIKAPLWPVHTWLPDAAAEATPGSAVLLVGVLDKVGTFGMLRYCLPLFPDASRFFTPLVITLSVVGILYGALLAIGQTDLKRLIAYTSVSHFGFIALGVFAMTSQAQAGAALYMVNHGFSTAALFLVAGFLISRRGSRLIADYGGVQQVAPVLAGVFLVAGLSALALPGLSSFVSEFLVLVGTFTVHRTAAVLATLGIILAAVYVLWLYQRTMTGPVKTGTEDLGDLGAREKWAVAPLVAVILALGVYPKPVLDVINPAVAATLRQVGATDPQPTVAEAKPVVGEAAGVVDTARSGGSR
ncbi:NADH-ubiquinone oxidoreductase chain M [Carbonactinospora thermoautotrophica]|uniref:NADH-ubiquinone oxidoreductase chain M n=1 Tax=Carbonactinospora thermoautotrophica TaxID=1469144 RepID=A0A132MY45_9ACTN|nr:NADH-quinone oxidoreductase subunit M [Carbonactinospora thermoautotrophica]KWX02789.1 NADH-ubiquinone oxidoreductase chain M [Carbonactinospora thermoautotrophica]